MTALCRMLIVGLTALGILPTVSLLAQTNHATTTLQALDGIVPTGTSVLQGDAAAQLFVRGLTSAELRVPILESSIAKSVSLGMPKQISDAQLASCFAGWLVMVGATDEVQADAREIHQYRQFLSRFAPHLFPHGVNGQVLGQMSQVEAVYLLDKMISHSGLPSLNDVHKYAGIKDPPSEAARERYRQALSSHRSQIPIAARTTSAIELLASIGIH